MDLEGVKLTRYPVTQDKSLRAWSSAELLATDYIKDCSVEKIHLFNDRFGVWNTLLSEKELTTIWTYASQKKAISLNLTNNRLPAQVIYKTPLDSLGNVDLALLKIPKSIELFELFLQQIYQASNSTTEVVCCFMTKYFTANILKVAELYFEEVRQTKAWKKARLLLLKKPKLTIVNKDFINSFTYNNRVYHQYYGVFSSNKIDIGTQFLLQNLHIDDSEQEVLDLACGNGVIAKEVSQFKSNIRFTLIDDFNLAIASSKLNLENENAIFYCEDSLKTIKKRFFDLIITNPPFHFEHENNIEVSLNLFKEVALCLKKKGRFVLVANRHLNYKTHLAKLFMSVTLLAQNLKFEVYECKQPNL